MPSKTDKHTDIHINSQESDRGIDTGMNCEEHRYPPINDSFNY